MERRPRCLGMTRDLANADLMIIALRSWACGLCGSMCVGTPKTRWLGHLRRIGGRNRYHSIVLPLDFNPTLPPP